MKNWRSSLFALAGVAIVAVGATVTVVTPPSSGSVEYVRTDEVAATAAASVKPVVSHISTPTAVKAIYMTQCVVGTPSFRDSLVEFIEDSSELNSVLIDIKDFSGGIAFPSDNPLLKDFRSTKCGAADMKAFVQTLHDKGIYVIGRITVFQDPLYAKTHPELAVQKTGGGVWHDNKGLAFIDVSAKTFWDYIVELSKVSYEEIGFDELNFDYIRFPSDGPMAEAVYSHGDGKSKAAALEQFFQYLHEQLEPLRSTSRGQIGVATSADLFGYITVHQDDLGIGQVLERALPYFDFIDPMVYPSHYNKGFAGLLDVNSDPYKVVYLSMKTAVERTISTTTPNYFFGAVPIASTSPQLYEKPSYDKDTMRPWLQAFDYPVPYTPEMVQAQIKANEDAGLDSYLMWDASNKYRSLREVLAE
ncbi:MAG: putative glycoside hydrolase [bacterium]|nr:putative glycoside hydrolase [bacterium]